MNLIPITNFCGWYFFVTEQEYMQNILGIIDASGNLVVKYSYTAYGTIASITGSLSSTIGAYNPFRYKGYYYDTETNMYYCKSRYYVPEWCRWLTADHISFLDPESVVGLNLFSYCYNDPVNYEDPSGNFAISAIIIGTIFGLIIGGGVAYDTAKNHGAEGWELAGWTTLGIITGGFLGALLGLFSGMSFSASIPTFGWVNAGGGLAIGVTGATTVTVTGAQVLVGAGALAALGGLSYMFSKHERKMTHKPPFSWVNQQEGIDAMQKYNGDANKAAREIMNNHRSNWSKGAGTEYNAIKKWLDRVIRKIFHLY